MAKQNEYYVVYTYERKDRITGIGTVTYRSSVKKINNQFLETITEDILINDDFKNVIITNIIKLEA